MKPYKLAIFDLDGTLYRGEEPIPYAVDAVNSMRNRGLQVAYLTNNSSQTKEFYVQKLRHMGFVVDPQEVYSSGIGATLHLQQVNKCSVFIVGMPGLIATFEEAGFSVVNRTHDGHARPEGTQSQAVVAGLCQEFTYELMAGAMAQIVAGAELVATNTDATFPLEGGRFVPGAGSIVAAIQTCSGAKPFVVGKPNRFLIDSIREDFHVDPTETLVVGDRLDTDIQAGKNGGCDTFLVLTGVERCD
jgi:phosphoglycolate/pyridoxal phosphate phosphatase family enzyme